MLALGRGMFRVGFVFGFILAAGRYIDGETFVFGVCSSPAVGKEIFDVGSAAGRDISVFRVCSVAPAVGKDIVIVLPEDCHLKSFRLKSRSSLTDKCFV
jgi:hypothetical protein